MPTKKDKFKDDEGLKVTPGTKPATKTKSKPKVPPKPRGK
jgi:hypothetical protein